MSKQAALGLIAAGLLVTALFHKRLYNTFAGPAPIEAAALATLEGAPFREFVTVVANGKPVQIGDLHDTGMIEVEYGRGGSRTTAVFRTLDVPGHRIDVRIEQGQDGDPVEGIIRSDGRRVMLDCRKTGYRMWSLAIAALAGLLLGFGAIQLLRRPEPKRPLRLFT